MERKDKIHIDNFNYEIENCQFFKNPEKINHSPGYCLVLSSGEWEIKKGKLLLIDFYGFDLLGAEMDFNEFKKR